MDTDLKKKSSDMLRLEDSFTEQQPMKTCRDEKVMGGVAGVTGGSHQTQS